MIWHRGHMSLDALTVTRLTLYSAVYVLWPHRVHRIEDATYTRCTFVVSVRLCVRHTGDLAKMAQPIEIPFPDRLVLGPRNRALDGTHIDATRRIRLNDPNAELTDG